MLEPEPLLKNGVQPGQPGFEPRERRRRSLASAADLVREADKPKLHTWGWPQLQVPLFAKLTVRGEPGGGKSTLATAVAISIASTAGVDVLYVSAEEGAEASAVERFARVATAMGIDVPPGLILSDARDVHEADEDIQAYEAGLRGKGGLIVVDSLSQLRPAQQWWEDLIASPHGVIFVMHVTTGGHARGGREPEFAVDTNIHVDDQGTAVIVKNRWGPTGQACAFNARQPPRLVPAAPTAAAPPATAGGEVIPFPKRP